MAVEYIDSIIKVSGGANALIGANIVDTSGNQVSEKSHLMLFYPQDELQATVNGTIADDGVHEYLVPASLTEGVKGKWWYCVCVNNEPICFKQPFYIV